ncbi:MAG: hypothetical protein LBB89_08790 [Treponema sp.]|jgi:hypothetical protein|nr:hypothetical protein [Treponema sp.]
MKKLIFVVLIGLLINTAAFAEHPDGLGFGGVLNFGWGQFFTDYYSGYFNPGLSLKIPHVPVFWGFFGNLKRDSVGFGLTGDYYIIDKTFVDEDRTNENGTYHLKMGWYLGAGIFANVDIWDYWKVFNVGLRIPGGVSWYIIEKLELFVGFAPSVGAWMVEGYSGLHWLANAEMGIRYWF